MKRRTRTRKRSFWARWDWSSDLTGLVIALAWIYGLLLLTFYIFKHL